MRRRGALLGVCFFLSFAYFYQAGGWNQNTRYDLVRAIVEHGRLTIDEYVRNTGDKAQCPPHVCSDKAPGATLTAVPIGALAQVVGVDLGSPSGSVIGSYLMTLAAASLPIALAAVALFWIALMLGASQGGAGFAATVFALASPTFAYATLFFGHALAAACLVFALAGAVALRRDGGPRRDLLLGLGVGMAGGWAVVTEFPTAPAVAILSVLALVAARGRTRWLRVAVGIAVTGALCVAVLAVYNQAAFGSPTHLGYANVTGFQGMKQGFMGVTYPKAHALYEILFGVFRGLYPIAPALILAPFGWWLLARAGERRMAIAAASVSLFFVLLNASYAYWDGGWAYGPRHITPALPFMALGLAPLWTRGSPALRVILALLAAAGVAASTIAVSVQVILPDFDHNPFSHILFPFFRHGVLGVNAQGILNFGTEMNKNVHAAWNLGGLAGLHGLASLAPLLVMWAATGALWWHWRERQPRAV